MFNLSGSEIIVILLLALVVLGPEKLPDALRRAGRTYAELKKMGTSFQDEVRSALDEPAREMRETADLLRTSITDTTSTLTGTGPKPARPRAAVAPAAELAAPAPARVDRADTDHDGADHDGASEDGAGDDAEALINRTLSGGATTADGATPAAGDTTTT